MQHYPVESDLVKKLGIQKLQRTCCVWESAQDSLRDKEGRLLVLEMATEETTIDTRSPWAEIPYFPVTVTRHGEEP